MLIGTGVEREWRMRDGRPRLFLFMQGQLGKRRAPGQGIVPSHVPQNRVTGREKPRAGGRFMS